MIKSLSNLSLITEASYWTVIMISRCVIWGCMSFWDAHGSFCQRRGSLHKPIHFFSSSLSCDEVRRSMSQNLSPIVYRWLIIKFRMLCFIICQQGIGISTSDTETSDWFLAPSFRWRRLKCRSVVTFKKNVMSILNKRYWQRVPKKKEFARLCFSHRGIFFFFLFASYVPFKVVLTTHSSVDLRSFYLTV